MISRLVYPYIRKILLHPDLHLNLLRMVHAEQELSLNRLTRPGDRLNAVFEVKRITETSAGEMLTLTTDIKKDGIPVAGSRSAFIVRGKKKGGREAGRRDRERPETFCLEVRTEKGQNYEYAEASLDRDFIHTSNFLARLAGLPGVIMQGLCVMAMIGNSLISHIVSNDITRVKGIRVRFARPVLPGQVLAVRGYESDKPGETPFAVFNADGRAVMKKGIFYYI